jgi:tetratricopeptide (TPR) repeat protein
MPYEAIQFTSRLSTEFPKNFYFNILNLESLIKTSRLVDAKKLIDVLDNRYSLLTERQKDWYGPYLNYEKALLLFYEQNYQETLPLIDKAIENYSGELDIILGNLFLLKGKVLDLKGNRKKAIAYYNKCQNLDNFSHAIKESRQYLSMPYLANGKNK